MQRRFKKYPKKHFLKKKLSLAVLPFPRSQGPDSVLLVAVADLGPGPGYRSLHPMSSDGIHEPFLLTDGFLRDLKWAEITV